MMMKAFALLMLVTGFSIFAHDEYEEVPVYDYAWEDCETDYDQICESIEYEKPSTLMIWLRSIGGSVYVGLCSMKDYVAVKWLALQKALSMKKVKEKKMRNEDALHEKST
jgi:hypothetical protein